VWWVAGNGGEYARRMVATLQGTQALNSLFSHPTWDAVVVVDATALLHVRKQDGARKRPREYGASSGSNPPRSLFSTKIPSAARVFPRVYPSLLHGAVLLVSPLVRPAKTLAHSTARAS
jgi:hypothetical protein